MSNPAPFEPVAALLERNLSIRHVFGEPVQHGDRTVVPVAKVAFGFGAGGGRGPRRTKPEPEPEGADDARRDAQGTGGGGGARLTPVGFLEIAPGGTRYVAFNPALPLIAAGAIGAVMGWLIGRRR